MKRETRCCHAQIFGDIAGWDTFRGGRDQHAEHPQTQRVGEGGEGIDGIVVVHISILVELSK
ncbi:MAG: hypothetical protein WBN78_00525 [Gammaproteobacteria bacterium]